jgi:DNA-binding NtrC family response regulator
VEQAIDSMRMDGATTIEVGHVRNATRMQPSAPAQSGTLKEAVDVFTKQFVETILKRHRYKQNPSAAELGITDRYLRDLITKFGISKEE